MTLELPACLCISQPYHSIVVAIDHDWATPPQVDILLPPITDLEDADTRKLILENLINK